MNIEAVKLAAEANQWAAIFPELILACVALGLLVLEIVLPKKQHGLIPVAASLGLAAVLVGLVVNFRTTWIDQDTFNGLLHHSLSGQLMRIFFVLSALLV